MTSANMFMLIYVRDQPVRMVFHGNIPEAEQDSIMASIHDPETLPVKLAIAEKFHDSGFHYTILTLNSSRTPQLDQKLRALYPSVRKITLDKTSAIRDAVRSIVIT